MVAIVDYGAGNLTSVRLAFEKIGVNAVVTSNPEEILAADRVVFPGVGSAGAAMTHLSGLGLVETLRILVGRGTPFLGICLGTQVILERSGEDGGVECLGLIRGDVRLLKPGDATAKIPHMGWNSVTFKSRHPVLDGLHDGSEFYFVHSYYPAPLSGQCVLGETAYGGTTFASVLGQAGIIATQFHPERSGRLGLKLLQNFSRWDGKC
ncbi:MAG: imidazole glycerol phosphate synthase subunit HisH [bacterium]